GRPPTASIAGTSSMRAWSRPTRPSPTNREAMRGTTALGSETGAVSAGLHYTVDTGVKPVNETFGPNNIRRRVSGEHEVRLVTIRNGRPLAHEVDLEVTGFACVDHKPQGRAFIDTEG